MSNQRRTVANKILGEQYLEIKHASGLTLLLHPMEGYSSAYALFATQYGSIDTCFKTGGEAEFAQVPEGIAHFLEHKLFESEDGDAFTRYASTGASPNAYTSFDRTAYLFSCTENFRDSLEILLDFVTKPYFTPETVEKEQGIIGQEIRMYEDDPDWRVFFNLLGAMYHENPVKIDITGTVESIAKIDADLLYRCYHTFYNLNNMVLSIAGNFSVDTVLELADQILKPASPVEIIRGEVKEPREVKAALAEQRLPVAQPLFHIGFKGEPAGHRENFLGGMLDEILSECVAGESTPLYRRLYDQGLINQIFSAEAMVGRDYSMVLFAGESRDPEAVRDALLAEVERLRREGVDKETFQRCKKAAYGRHLSSFGSVRGVASQMMGAHFAGCGLYDSLDRLALVTLEEINARLRKSMDPAHSALSVVRPA